MMHSFSLDGERKPFVKILERGRPYWSPRAVEHRNRRVMKVTREPIPLPLSLLIDGISKEDLLNKAEEIALWLNTDDVAPLIFDDQPNRIYWSILDGSVDEEEIVSFSKASLEFICVDKTSLERTLTLNNTLTRTIAGHEPTSWCTKTVFTSNVTGFELQFNAPGETALRDINKIVVKGNFISGDTLEIDYAKRRITLNSRDISNQLVIMQSNYAELPTGTVEFEASYKTDVFYHERYY